MLIGQMGVGVCVNFRVMRTKQDAVAVSTGGYKQNSEPCLAEKERSNGGQRLLLA